MDGGFHPFAPPEFSGVAKALNHQPDGPEHTKPQGNPFPERGAGEEVGRGDAQQTHQENRQGDEKGMDDHHLAVDQADPCQFLLPMEIRWKNEMQEGEADQQQATKFKQGFHRIG